MAPEWGPGGRGVVESTAGGEARLGGEDEGGEDEGGEDQGGEDESGKGGGGLLIEIAVLVSSSYSCSSRVYLQQSGHLGSLSPREM